MKKIFIILSLIVIPFSIFSQVIQNPNIGLSSHNTATIDKVDYRSDATEISITIKNEIEGGWVCISGSTLLRKPDGTYEMLKSVEGIPACPDQFKFNYAGESVSFKLIFPPTGKLLWFDIIENCDNNCFAFYGVTTDDDINYLLDDASACLYFLKDEEGAIEDFKSFITEFGDFDFGIEGAVYSNIITLFWGLGKKEEAKEWYSKMLNSNAPHLDMYIKNLRANGIYY
jgi:hypothetical protein